MNSDLLGFLIVSAIAVLVAVMFEAHRSRLRRKAPYTRSRQPEPIMPTKPHNLHPYDPPFDPQAPAHQQQKRHMPPPAEHSRNDYDRKWDTALTQAIGDLVRASVVPWGLVLIDHKTEEDILFFNGSWTMQLGALGTDISAAKQMTASVTTGNPSLGTQSMRVHFGKAELLCESDEEMGAIQRTVSLGAHTILRSYIAKRSAELAAQAVQSAAAYKPLPVHSKLIVNGSSVMTFRTDAEAREYVGALNGVYETATATRRKAMAEAIVALCQHGITTDAFRQPTGMNDGE